MMNCWFYSWGKRTHHASRHEDTLAFRLSMCVFFLSSECKLVRMLQTMHQQLRLRRKIRARDLIARSNPKSPWGVWPFGPYSFLECMWRSEGRLGSTNEHVDVLRDGSYFRIGLRFVRLLNFEEACLTSRAAIDTALIWSISHQVIRDTQILWMRGCKSSRANVTPARELGGAGVWKTTHGWRHQGPSHIHAVTKWPSSSDCKFVTFLCRMLVGHNALSCQMIPISAPWIAETFHRFSCPCRFSGLPTVLCQYCAMIAILSFWSSWSYFMNWQAMVHNWCTKGTTK